MRSKSTELMERIKEYVEDYMMKHPGEKPTTRDVAAAVSVSSASASRYLVEMDERGMIEYDRGIIRTEKTGKIAPAIRNIGIVGSIPCGTPEEQEEAVETYVPIPLCLLDGDNYDYFILKAMGDSMIDAGIAPGDLVVIKKVEEAHDGQIVAALVNGFESTLKRYKVAKNGVPYLWAENKEWEDKERVIRASRFSIQGVAIKVIKEV